MKSFTRRLRDLPKTAMSQTRQAFRAVLSNLNTGAPVQLAQGEALKDEQLQAAELFQHFGFTSAPPAGTQLIVLPLGGQTAHSVIVATENGAYRLDVQGGEACLYNQWGAFIRLKKEKIIEIECDELKIKAKDSVSIETKEYAVNASTGVTYQTPAFAAEGPGGVPAEANITGALHASDDLTARSVSLVAHVHRDSGGSGNSGQPVGG